MIKTLGLTHLALTVSDLERSFQFYHGVFGMLAVYREPHFIQAQTPATRSKSGTSFLPTQGDRRRQR